MASRPRPKAQRNSNPKRQLSLYFSREAERQRLLERLEALARQRRRSLNFLILEALARYLQEEEAKERRIRQGRSSRSRRR